MFHKLGLRNQIDVPIELFKGNTPKISIVEQANVVIDDYVGSETGSAIDFLKIESLRKATSEAIERRCSMLGVNSGGDPEKLVETWDLISKRKKMLKQKYTRLLYGSTDTTGTAIHTDASIATFSAVKELLEKNSLFLFWYGSVGKKIESRYYEQNNYYNDFKTSGYQVSVFLCDFFKPLLSVFVIAYKENDLFICGIGTDTDIEIAIKRAFEEAFLLGYMQYYGFLFDYAIDENNWSSPEKILHMEKLNSLSHANMCSYKGLNSSFDEVIDSLPPFVQELHLIFIAQFLNPHLKCMRVYSQNLINCLPLKNNIDLSKEINTRTINLDKKTLNCIPQCPMS